MRKVFLLVLFCCVASPEQHSLNFFFSGFSGVPNFPEFVGVVMVDGVEVVYCDSNTKRAEPKQSWMKKVFDDDPKHMDWYTNECYVSQRLFRSTIESLVRHASQTRGVCTFQRIYGCEWDKEVHAFDKYGHDGEIFMEFDPRFRAWIPSTHPEAFPTKLEWDSDEARIKNIMSHLTQHCPDWLKKYLDYGNNTLRRIELPSVSLLQKTPSSPVSCHATGFYPDRVVMFWRKDGEELHEDVDHREILPNHDGSFQMSVDLNLSSVPPEDWRRYDCVFYLSGVEDHIVTRLDKDVIKTNWVPYRAFPTGHFIGGCVAGLLLVVCFIVLWTRRKELQR